MNVDVDPWADTIVRNWVGHITRTTRLCGIAPTEVYSVRSLWNPITRHPYILSHTPSEDVMFTNPWIFIDLINMHSRWIWFTVLNSIYQFIPFFTLLAVYNVSAATKMTTTLGMQITYWCYSWRNLTASNEQHRSLTHFSPDDAKNANPPLVFFSPWSWRTARVKPGMMSAYSTMTNFDWDSDAVSNVILSSVSQSDTPSAFHTLSHQISGRRS